MTTLRLRLLEFNDTKVQLPIDKYVLAPHRRHPGWASNLKVGFCRECWL